MRKRRTTKNKKFLDRVVIGCLIAALLFTVSMIVLFCLFQAVPDTLIISVFGALFGELGFCSLIINRKLKEGNKDGQQD